MISAFWCGIYFFHRAWPLLNKQEVMPTELRDKFNNCIIQPWKPKYQVKNMWRRIQGDISRPECTGSKISQEAVSYASLWTHNDLEERNTMPTSNTEYSLIKRHTSCSQMNKIRVRNNWNWKLTGIRTAKLDDLRSGIHKLHIEYPPPSVCLLISRSWADGVFDLWRTMQIWKSYSC